MPTTLSTISASKVSMPWGAAYTSQNINKIHASQPAGILYGFTPSTPAGLTLELEVDETLSASIARVRGSGLVLTVNETASVTFDLTAYAGTTVYIALNVTYAVDTDTVATYKLYTSAEYASTPNPAETIWLCAVTVPSSGSLAAANVDTSVRSRAWKEVPFSEDRDKWEALIQDPYMGYETSLGDYTAQGGATSLVLTDAVVSGALNSIMGTTSGASGNVYRKLQALGAVTPGSTIRYRFYYKATACTATKIGLRFRFMKADRTVISFSINGPALSATTADWTLYEKEVLVPAAPSEECYFVGIEVGAQGLSAGTFYIEQPQVFVATAHPHKRGVSAKAVDASILRLMGHVGAGHLYAHSDAEDSVQVKATTITIGSEVAVEFESAPIVPEVTNVLSYCGLALAPLFTYTDSGDGATVYQFSGGGITIEIGTIPSISFSGDASSETINAYCPVSLPYDAVITTLRIVGKFAAAGLDSTAVATLWSYDNAGGISSLASVSLDASLSTNQTAEDTLEHAHQPGDTDNRLLLQVSLTVPIVDGTKITITAVEIVYTVNRVG
jgi:hypothetical protein